jgi:hypothetical protein
MRLGCAALAILVFAALVPPAAAKYENVRRIGVISAIGDHFTVQKVGATAFGNDVKELSIEPWNIDAFVIAKVRTALAGRFEVRPVSYRNADFQVTEGNVFNSTNSKIATAVRQASPQGLDAYVVVTKGLAVYPQTNQLMKGLGIIERSGLGTSTIKVFALFRITVIDGHDLAGLGSVTGLRPGDIESVHNTSREVDQTWWPTVLDAGANAKLKSAVAELLAQSLPVTLQKLELTK